MPQFSFHDVDSAVVVNLAAAAAVALVGFGVLLYERFSAPSRRLAVFTSVAAVLLLCTAYWIGTAGAVSGFWLRCVLAADALIAPAVYGVAVHLVRAPNRRLLRAAWIAGLLLAIWSLTSPTLMFGVRAINDRQYDADGVWAGVVLMAFVTLIVGATIIEFMRAWRLARYADDRRRALAFAAGFGIGALGLLDFVHDPLPLGGIGFTAVSVPAGAFIFAVVAARYRAFAAVPSFAAERILDVMADGVLLCDEEGRIRNANRAARSLLGRSGQQLQGQRLVDLLREPAPRVGVATDSDGAAVAELRHQVRDRELLLLAADGARVDVSLSSEPLMRGSRLLGSVVVLRDIGERLRVARMLRTTEQRYLSLFWNNPALAYELDLEGRVIQVNPAAERALGLPNAELTGRPFAELVHPGDRADAVAQFERVFAGQAQEYRLRLAPPRSRTLELKGVSIPVVRDGAIVRIFGMALDLTGEERARRELELQRLEFAQFFESSPEAILVADENNVVVRINPEFTRTFGYTVEDALGCRVDDLIVPAELADEGMRLTEAARRGEVVRIETVRRRRDGTLLDVSLLAREIRLPGRPPQLYGIYHDVSEHKRAERTLRQRDEELRHAQRLEAVGKLAGGVAHDFNNLVTVINGHAEFALEALPPKHPVRDDLLEVQRAGERAASLTQQLLAFSRRQVLRPEVVDAAVVIEDVRRMIGRIIGEHIRFDTSLDGDARVRVDRGQLEQLLVNLIVNARDAMPDGGRLEISAARTRLSARDQQIAGWDVQPGEYVRIVVADTGIGMSEETRARAFDPFFTTKGRGKGSGLGLATVFGIAKQSGGHVTVASAVGAGTEVRVWLPAVEADAVVDEPCTEPPPAEPPPPPRRARVLVVEDEEALRQLAARVLRRAGYDVLLASDGVEGLRIAHEAELDLVLTDLVMPRMGGRELARRLAAEFAELPVLLMSGYDDEIATGQPGESLLSKPFTPAELAARVELALADGTASHAS